MTGAELAACTVIMGDSNQTWDIADNISDLQTSLAPTIPNTTFPSADVVEPPCPWILYADIGDSK